MTITVAMHALDINQLNYVIESILEFGNVGSEMGNWDAPDISGESGIIWIRPDLADLAIRIGATWRSVASLMEIHRVDSGNGVLMLSMQRCKLLEGIAGTHQRKFL
jgi:hypothetical protein